MFSRSARLSTWSVHNFASPNLLNSLTQKSQGQIVKPRARENMGRLKFWNYLEKPQRVGGGGGENGTF